MCGRFSFAFTKKIIEERFEIELGNEYLPRYNCAPSQKLAVITNQEPNKLSFLKWGLIPYWARDVALGNNLINAKAETILEKPSFKNSFIHKRCLIPADSFYEWSRDKKKTPYRFFLKNNEPFTMAGIWDVWNDGANLQSTFSIITTESNEIMQKIHHRMPVILEKNIEKDWLLSNDIDLLQSFLKPYPSEKMDITVISNLVNSPKNDFIEIHKVF